MKKIKRIVISDFISSCSVTAFITYVDWFLYYKTKNQSWVSMVSMFAMLTILFSMLGGYVVDQSSKIKLLRKIAILRIIIFVLSLIFLFWLSSVWVVAFIVVLNAILNIVYTPLSESIAPTFLSDHDNLIKANSWISLASQLSGIVSSGLSVIMVLTKQSRLAIIYVLISIIISLLTLNRIHADPVPKKQISFSFRTILNQFKSGIKLILDNHLVSFMIPIALVTNFCFWTIWLLMPKYSVDIFKPYQLTYNLIDIGFTIGGICGSVLLSKVRAKIGKMSNYPFYLVGQSMMLIILGIIGLLPVTFTTFLMVGIIWIFYGIFNSISSIIYFSVVQMSTSKNNIGKIVGAVLTIFSIANPLSAICSPILVKISSVQFIIIMLGVIMLLIAIIVFTPPYRREFLKYE